MVMLHLLLVRSVRRVLNPTKDWSIEVDCKRYPVLVGFLNEGERLSITVDCNFWLAGGRAIWTKKTSARQTAALSSVLTVSYRTSIPSELVLQLVYTLAPTMAIFVSISRQKLRP